MNEGEISIAGIDKAELLAALFNGSRQQGKGVMPAAGANDMTVEQARGIIAAHRDPDLYFDYLYGRVMKVGIRGDVLETRLYNRDVGHGVAERIVTALQRKAVAA